MKKVSLLQFISWFVCAFLSGVASRAGEEPVSSAIHINQIGYAVSGPKIALVSSPIGVPFHVNQTGKDRPVLKGMLQLAEAGDAASGANVWKADFSVIRASGEFVIEVPGLGKSQPFQVGEKLYNEVATQSLRSFAFLRCGSPLAKKWANEWSRDACHLADAVVFSPTSATDIVHSATGGWHDGSDEGKYAINGISAASLLLLHHELRPEIHADGTLQIPESGNGVPDILDEARGEIEWILRIQDNEGGIHHKVTPLEPLISEPKNSKDQPKRFLFSPSTATTAAGCALLAKASRLYLPSDATFAVHCLQQARQAWAWVEQRPNDEGFHNPENVLTPSLTDPDDLDERFWAALEMYLATNDKQFFELAESIAERKVPLLSSSGYWGNPMPFAAAGAILSMTKEKDNDMVKELQQDVLTLADSLLKRIETDGFGLSLREGEFTWGSNGAILQNAVILILADRLAPKPEYRAAVLEQMHYLLGRNPVSRSFVTGFGQMSPQNLYQPSQRIPPNAKVIPGLLVGGPNQSLNDGVLKSAFSSTAAPATIYKDDAESFSSNDYSIGWNAALVLVAGYLYE